MAEDAPVYEVHGGRKDDQVICPLMYAGTGIFVYCKKEKCAWWNDRKCAIFSIAKALDYIAYDKPVARG